MGRIQGDTGHRIANIISNPAFFKVIKIFLNKLNDFSERENLAKYIESKFISEITTIAQKEGAASGVDPPKSIPFIPYGYQTKMSRAAIRSHPILKDFHEFLINETELVCDGKLDNPYLFVKGLHKSTRTVQHGKVLKIK